MWLLLQILVEVRMLVLLFRKATAIVHKVEVLLMTVSVISKEYKDFAEKEFIKFKLEKNNWNVSKTADDIDIQRSHLYSKIEKFGLKRAE